MMRTFLVFCAGISTLACGPKPGEDLSTEQMSAVVLREQPALEACYQAGLDQTPYEHEFRIQAALTIRPDGTVAKVELDQVGIQSLGPCVEKAIRAWRFPQAKAQTKASLPLVFKPKVENKVVPANLQLPPGFHVVQPDERPK